MKLRDFITYICFRIFKSEAETNTKKLFYDYVPIFDENFELTTYGKKRKFDT